MTIIRRAVRTQNFTIVPNEILDSGLSWSATGVLIYLLSKPDNWQVRKQQLVNLQRGAGDNALRSIFEELETAGYMVRQQTRGEDGKLGFETLVYDTPERESPGQTTRWISTSGSSTSGSTTSGQPPPLVSTDVVSTDVASTETHLSSCDDGEQLLLLTDGLNSGASSTCNSSEVVVDPDEYTEDFLKAWKIYPRKKGVNKKAAFRKWKASLKKKGVTVEMLMTATENYAAFVRSQGTEQHYMKLPATFYGPDEHWRDHVKRQSAGGATDRRFNVIEHEDESETRVLTAAEALGLA